MFRSLAKTFVLFALVVAGSFGIVFYRDHYSVDRKLAALEQEKRTLQQFVQRLSDERRVAEILVLDQTKSSDGILSTTLLFQEYARDNSALTPKRFTVQGEMAHFDALVIKFDHGFVEEGDSLRGKTIALFSKVFGDHQTPEQAFSIDEPGKIPDIYRGTDPRVMPFEQDLWNNFWRLTQDAAYRNEKGVRVANGQSVWGPFEPGRIYTITLENGGGMNMTDEPMKGIYSEALKHNGLTTAPAH